VYPDDRVKYAFPQFPSILPHDITHALFTTVPQPCGVYVVHPALLIPDEPSLVELCKMSDVLAAVCSSCPSDDAVFYDSSFGQSRDVRVVVEKTFLHHPPIYKPKGRIPLSPVHPRFGWILWHGHAPVP